MLYSAKRTCNEWHVICYRTFRKDCEASISLSASEDGTALVVNQFNDQHNHEISQVGQLDRGQVIVCILNYALFNVYFQ